MRPATGPSLDISSPTARRLRVGSPNRWASPIAWTRCSADDTMTEVAVAGRQRSRLIVGAILACSAVVLAVQLASVRPRLWPGGAGMTLSGENVFASLAAPGPVARIRPPDVQRVAGMPVVI